MEPNSEAPVTSTSTLIGPGDLIKNAWRMFADHWQLFAGIAAVPVCIRIVALIFALTLVGIPISVLFMLAGLVFSIAMVPALVDAIHKIRGGTAEGLNVTNQYKFGFSMFWSFLLVLIIETLSVGGAAFLFIIPGVIVGVYLSMYIFTRVIDGKRGYAALTESFALIRNRWLPVFGRMFVIGLVAGLAVIILSAVLSVFGIAGPVIANAIISLTILPMALIAAHDLYMDLKRTRDTSVQVGGFKKWLIAFTIIGVAAAILVPILLVSAFNALKETYLIRSQNSYYIPTQSIQQ